LKNRVKRILQKTLGFNTYLKIFAKFKVNTLRRDSKEGDFFVFMKLLKDEGTILDIGANLGIMTWHLLSNFKKAEIWAFEPIPDNLNVLRATTADVAKNRLRIFDKALGDEKGKLKMVLPKVEDVKMQGLSHVVHESITEFNEGDFYEVEVEKLDNLIHADLKVSGIKIDVENFEYFVLKGGQEVIRKNKPIIYSELWDNENRYKCFEFLESLGYETHFRNGTGLKPLKGNPYKGQNFFFIPKGSEAYQELS